MVECHLAKVDVEGSNPFSRSEIVGVSFGASDEPSRSVTFAGAAESKPDTVAFVIRA